MELSTKGLWVVFGSLVLLGFLTSVDGEGVKALGQISIFGFMAGIVMIIIGSVKEGNGGSLIMLSVMGAAPFIVKACTG